MKTLVTLPVLLVIGGMIAITSEKHSEEVTPVTKLSTAVSASGDGLLVSVRELSLIEGVDPEAFEKFAAEEFSPALNRQIPGTRALIVKGERGNYVGKYLYLWMFDSVHIRDLYFPEPDQPSPLWESVMEASGGTVDEAFNKLSEYAEIVDDYTDYVAIE